MGINELVSKLSTCERIKIYNNLCTLPIYEGEAGKYQKLLIDTNVLILASFVDTEKGGSYLKILVG